MKPFVSSQSNFLKITISLFSLLLLFYNQVFPQVSETNSELCQNLYIWEFESEGGESDRDTKILTAEVEDIISQINGCVLLERREFNKISLQLDNENRIQDLESPDKDNNIQETLKTIKADRVIFGTVSKDHSSNVLLRLSLENLNSKRIISTSIDITAKIWIDRKARKALIKENIEGLLGLTSNNPKDPHSPGNQTMTVNGIEITFTECVRTAEDGYTRCFYNLKNKDSDKKAVFSKAQLVDENGKYYKAIWHNIAGENTWRKIYKEVETKGYFIFEGISDKVKIAKVIEFNFSTLDSRNLRFERKIMNMKIRHE